MKRCRILHLDMDAFFASVEVLDHPKLKGQAVIVGGRGPRSVVCACSYETRKFGVRSAMPMRHARELCPKAIVIPPRIERYADISHRIFQYLRGIVPLVEKTSIDEGYLDITHLDFSDDEAFEFGKKIKSEISSRFGLICSVGIAPCKFIAKIASDLRKPDALVVVRDEEAKSFLTDLEVSRIPGVGKVGEKKLHLIGIKTIGDLRQQNRKALTGLFGKWGDRLYDLARGIDPQPVVVSHTRKSYGREHTFDLDQTSMEPIESALLEESQEVAKMLKKSGIGAKTVTLKLRYSNFDLISRQHSYERPIRTAREIGSIARELLLRTEAGRRPVRLVGVSVSGLVNSTDQAAELPLFADEDNQG